MVKAWLAARVDIYDALVIGGTLVTSAGVWQVYQPAALMFAGMVALMIGITPILLALRRAP